MGPQSIEGTVLGQDSWLSLMSILIDLVYLLGLLAASPVLLPRLFIRWKRKYDWRARLGHVSRLRPSESPRILIHSVSVGEVNAIGTLVTNILKQPDPCEVVIAVTTETGFSRASALYGDRCKVVRYPLDFSRSVRRFLDSIQPDLAVMVELELWPNFTRECRRRDIPLAVVNGRLSQRSFRGYSRAALFIRPMFRRLNVAAVQTNTYAERFRALGASRSAVTVTGTMKWDSALTTEHSEKAHALAESLGIDPGKPLLVAGSTAPEEHALLVDATPPGVQLLCAPRRPEWFDDAARVMNGCARRSLGESGSEHGRFLLDTIGELSSAYALADVVVVGRSFGNLHGSDMMEPCALGKPVVVGPETGDFTDTVEKLLEGDGLIVTESCDLRDVLAQLFNSPEMRSRLSDNARAVVLSEQGATERTRSLLENLVRASFSKKRAVDA
jgi:3-deoxy-D-manno-octulosonic-acid transferase